MQGDSLDVVHLQLDFIDAILSVCDTEQQCHPEAKFWFPLANLLRLQVYLKLSKIEKIQCMRHFTLVVKNGIVAQLQRKD